jgi:transcriptional regulator with XRE-family HTH domain
VRNARRAKGITQGALADAADLSQDMISRIERCKTSASLETIEQIAEALGVPVDELFTGEISSGTERRRQALHHIYTRLSRFNDDQVIAIQGIVDNIANLKP